MVTVPEVDVIPPVGAHDRRVDLAVQLTQMFDALVAVARVVETVVELREADRVGRIGHHVVARLQVLAAELVEARYLGGLQEGKGLDGVGWREVQIKLHP